MNRSDVISVDVRRKPKDCKPVETGDHYCKLGTDDVYVVNHHLELVNILDGSRWADSTFGRAGRDQFTRITKIRIHAEEA